MRTLLALALAVAPVALASGCETPDPYIERLGAVSAPKVEPPPQQTPPPATGSSTCTLGTEAVEARQQACGRTVAFSRKKTPLASPGAVLDAAVTVVGDELFVAIGSAVARGKLNDAGCPASELTVTGIDTPAPLHALSKETLFWAATPTSVTALDLSLKPVATCTIAPALGLAPTPGAGTSTNVFDGSRKLKIATLSATSTGTICSVSEGHEVRVATGETLLGVASATDIAFWIALQSKTSLSIARYATLSDEIDEAFPRFEAQGLLCSIDSFSVRDDAAAMLDRTSKVATLHPAGASPLRADLSAAGAVRSIALTSMKNGAPASAIVVAVDPSSEGATASFTVISSP